MVLQAIVGVSILLEREGKILIAKRSEDKDFGPGIWELPSGRVEKKEDLMQGLVREAFEELRISITNAILFDAYTFQRIDYSMILLNYHCEFEGEPQISEEHSELRLVDLEEVKDYFSHDRQVESIDKYLLHKNCFDK